MEPWDKERRARLKRRLDKEANRARDRIGAKCLVAIAFFEDGRDPTFLHVLDGGTCPNGDLKRVYEQMISAHTIVAESGGEDVAIS